MSSNRSVERNIIFFTCIAHAMTHVYIHLFTAIQPEIQRDFGLDPRQLTELASISLYLFGIGAIPAGWLSDRYGEKPLLVAFFILSAAGGIVAGFAGEVWHLTLAFVLIGLGTSIYHPVGLALISKGIRRSARAMGINGLFGSLGTALSPLAARQMTEWTGDWRWAFAGLAIPMIILAVLLGISNTGGKRTTDAADPEKDNGTGTGGKTIVGLLLCAMLFGGVYYSLIITKLPQHFDEGSLGAAHLRTYSKAGYLLFLVYLIGGFGQVFAGRWMEKREGRGLYIALLIGTVPLVWYTGWQMGMPMLVGAAAMAFFMFAVQPVENTLLARYTAPRLRGRIYGLKFILTFGVGMGSGTHLSGWIEEGGLAGVLNFGSFFSGLPGVFNAAACFAAASLLMAILARATRRAPAEAGEPQRESGKTEAS
ncbi:MAG: MFS transporter [Planctomycetota bacterium]|nr:MFS transporter [Planctomycetota bacterium]